MFRCANGKLLYLIKSTVKLQLPRSFTLFNYHVPRKPLARHFPFSHFLILYTYASYQQPLRWCPVQGHAMNDRRPTKRKGWISVFQCRFTYHKWLQCLCDGVFRYFCNMPVSA